MKHSATRLAAVLVLLLGFTQATPGWADAGPPTEESWQTAQQPTVKEGGRDDVDAIGNREIGGRGLGNWYSLETEIRIGKEYAQIVESSVKLVSDQIITEYVNRVGQNLARNSDAKVPFTFQVIEADDLNAFAFPGGYIFVNTGLIVMAEEEDEFAGFQLQAGPGGKDARRVETQRHARTLQEASHSPAGVEDVPRPVSGAAVGQAP